MTNKPVAIHECPTPREAFIASSVTLAGTFQHVSDERLNNIFQSMGHAEDEFAGLRQKLHDRVNKTMREGPGIKIRGVNLPMFYSIYQIPGSPLSIRIWAH